MPEQTNSITLDESQLPSVIEKTRRMEFQQRVHDTIAIGHVLTPVNLLDVVRTLRELVMDNAHRIKKARQIANYLGGAETILVEDLAQAEDPKQEKLPLDKPEPVEAELGYENGRARRRKAS